MTTTIMSTTIICLHGTRNNKVFNRSPINGTERSIAARTFGVLNVHSNCMSTAIEDTCETILLLIIVIGI